MPSAKSLRSKKAYADGISREAMAAWFLRAKFYRILGTRLRTPFGEVDILAEKNGALIVVEVKSRASEAAGFEAITPQQRMRLIRAAQHLQAQFQRRLRGKNTGLIRMDAFLFAPKCWPRHIKNAFGE